MNFVTEMKNPPRKICVVTGSRAEYGLLFWLMKGISVDPELQLQIIATGMHLSPEFGLTYRQIEADGFKIDAKVEMLLSSDTSVGIAKSMGVGTIGFAEAFDRLKPDIIVMLGDRFELLAAAQAALVMCIPVAHIHGGETSEGAFDEGIRHAITKMSRWHFVAAEPYRKRVVQLGESPERVFNLGAPGLDYLRHIQWVPKQDLEKMLELNLRAPIFLVTYHPVTLGEMEPQLAINELLHALDEFPDATVVLTHPNADTCGRALTSCINDWVMANPQRARSCVSLGNERYLSLMRICDVVVGNSSSALIEAPALKKATVNIGDRQKGRLAASSVVHASESSADIVRAIGKVLSKEFQDALPSTNSLYGCEQVSERTISTLKCVDTQSSWQKSFFNIEHAF